VNKSAPGGCAWRGGAIESGFRAENRNVTRWSPAARLQRASGAAMPSRSSTYRWGPSSDERTPRSDWALRVLAQHACNQQKRAAFVTSNDKIHAAICPVCGAPPGPLVRSRMVRDRASLARIRPTRTPAAANVLVTPRGRSSTPTCF
jgi:hypothetical protein